jgi:hypothetical protein
VENIKHAWKKCFVVRNFQAEDFFERKKIESWEDVKSEIFCAKKPLKRPSFAQH